MIKKFFMRTVEVVTSNKFSLAFVFVLVLFGVLFAYSGFLMCSAVANYVSLIEDPTERGLTWIAVAIFISALTTKTTIKVEKQ